MSKNHAEYYVAHVEGKAAAEKAHQDIPDTGAVGIASVVISPGTSGFARWLRNRGYATSVTSWWARGTHVRISTGKQSYAANDAAAKAYAAVIKERFPDLDVHAHTRFD